MSPNELTKLRLMVIPLALFLVNPLATAQEISFVPVRACAYEEGTCHDSGDPCLLSNDCGGGDWCERICAPVTFAFGLGTDDTGNPTDMILVPAGSAFQVELEVRLNGWGQAPGGPTLGAFKASLVTDSLLGLSADPPNPGVDLLLYRGADGLVNAVHTVTKTCHEFIPPATFDDTGQACESFPSLTWDACPAEALFCEDNPEWMPGIMFCGIAGCCNEDSWPSWCGLTSPGFCITDQPGTSWYTGTLILDVPPTADGIYTLDFELSPAATFLNDCAGSVIPGVTRTSGSISIGGACCLPGGSCMPLTGTDCSMAGVDPIGGSCTDDSDGDGVADPCDPCPSDNPDDPDGDGICTSVDNCPDDSNTAQDDNDGDGLGNACDNCPDNANADQKDCSADGQGDACEPAAEQDDDQDGVCNGVDNCPDHANPGQENCDGDGEGDACESDPLDTDSDDDGFCDRIDNCPDIANPNQEDCDDDGLGDMCAVAPGGPSLNCNSNDIPDECEILRDKVVACSPPSGPPTCFGGPFYCDEPGCDPDCNDNGIPDWCDVESGISDDCGPDPGNGVPDECEPDCNANGEPDGCDITRCTGDPACGDCQAEGQPGHGVPDWCDINVTMISEDSDSDGVPDECFVAPALSAPYPHDRRKNRYISFDPNKPENDSTNVAFKVELLSIDQGSCDDGTGAQGGNSDFCRGDRGAADCKACSTSGDSCILASIDCSPSETCDPTGAVCVNDLPNSGGSNVGLVWWIGPEKATATDPNLNIHLLVSEPFRKVSDNWPNPIHAGDCEVVPRASYGVRAVEAASGTESDELVVETTQFPPVSPPAPFWWGDAVGVLAFHCNGDIREQTCDPNTSDGDCTGPDVPAACCTGMGSGLCDCPGGDPCERAWMLPNGIVNVDDVTAVMWTIAPAPPTTVSADITWVDLHGNDSFLPGSQNYDPPNYLMNVSDLQQNKFGFEGRPYSFYDPADCPDEPDWP